MAGGDPDFRFDRERLMRAVDLLGRRGADAGKCADLPAELPEEGWGDAVLDRLAPLVIGRAADLGAPAAFAHMDPPTPWMTWGASLWTAALNQNLLHPATAPAARDLERQVIAWLAPFFGMGGGHMTAGSTLANLTALWVARDLAGARGVVASAAAHVSIEKAARLLGMPYRQVAVDHLDRLDRGRIGDVSNACLVLTAGTTGTGAIDPLDLAGDARWSHVDAAWAGPMRLSEKAAPALAGIERADSIAVSAHKWLFQPKESALILFKDADRAHAALSFRGGYLAAPNVGVLGSSGARAVPLAAMLLAWGRSGLASRIEHCLDLARAAAAEVASRPELELFAEPACGVVAWRPLRGDVDMIAREATPALVSTTTARSLRWLRFVAANPNADLTCVSSFVARTANSSSRIKIDSIGIRASSD